LVFNVVRVKDLKRPYLLAKEVLKIVPPEDYPTRLDHIANIFMLDSNKDGRFTLEELEQFAIFYSENTKKSNRYEYQYQI
jgi:hypothetical protein